MRTLPSALPHTATRTTPTHSPADCHTLPQIHCMNAAIHCRTLPRASTAAHYRTHCRTLLHTAAKCRTAAHSRAHCHTYIHAQVHCRTLPRALRERTAVRTATNCHSHYCRRTVLAALPHTVAHTRNNTTINNNFNNTSILKCNLAQTSSRRIHNYCCAAYTRASNCSIVGYLYHACATILL